MAAKAETFAPPSPNPLGTRQGGGLLRTTLERRTEHDLPYLQQSVDADTDVRYSVRGGQSVASYAHAPSARSWAFRSLNVGRVLASSVTLVQGSCSRSSRQPARASRHGVHRCGRGLHRRRALRRGYYRRTRRAPHRRR